MVLVSIPHRGSLTLHASIVTGWLAQHPCFDRLNMARSLFLLQSPLLARSGILIHSCRMARSFVPVSLAVFGSLQHVASFYRSGLLRSCAPIATTWLAPLPCFSQLCSAHSDCTFRSPYMARSDSLFPSDDMARSVHPASIDCSGSLSLNAPIQIHGSLSRYVSLRSHWLAFAV